MGKISSDTACFFEIFPEALDDIENEVFLEANHKPDPSRDRYVIIFQNNRSFEEKNREYQELKVTEKIMK